MYLDDVKSWPKVLGTFDKMPNGGQQIILKWEDIQSILPPKQCWNSGSSLDESTSTLCWKWGGTGEQ